uniref:Uncharacterized protein n=1 Tax=Aegilops tauschii subsp. strangulata TaxID=200361 RepID=A0A453RWN4_AEGTS
PRHLHPNGAHHLPPHRHQSSSQPSTMAATLSSVSASSKHCSVVRAQHSPLPSILTTSPAKKTAFHGVSLVDSRWLRSGGARRRLVQVNAKTAGAAKNIEVEVDKPLGLTLGQKSGGGVVITVSTTSRPPLLSSTLASLPENIGSES